MRSRGILLMAIAALLPGLAGAEDLSTLIQGGDRTAALAAIQAKADVNAAQGDGSTPLLWAVYQVDHELVKALLAHGANPNTRNALGATPLGEAVDLADPEMVRLLLNARANPNQGNQDNQTPLMVAARTGSLPVVELLVKAGATVNVREDTREQTALMWAIGANSGAVTGFLIKHGAEVDVRSAVNDWGNQITSEPRAQYRPTGGLTPLLYAVRSGCLDCVKLLLKAGANIDRPTPDGITPLMNAIDNQQYEIANYLLDRQANPNLFDWWGRSALYTAVDMRTYSNRFLLGAGNAPAEGAAPPLDPAALQLAKRLLELGVDPNTQLDMHRPGRGGNTGRFTDDLLTTGCTPLLRAAIAFDREAVELLLNHGALVDLPNVMGVTPLMGASGMGLSPRDTRGSYGIDAQARSLPVLELLVRAGADVNARVTDTSGHTAIIARPSSMTNRQGQTALYGAINWGWTRVAGFLLEHGAKADVKDAAGKTVMDALTGAAGGRDFQAKEDMSKLIRAAAGA
jgi:uncharacterized protein